MKRILWAMIAAAALGGAAVRAADTGGAAAAGTDAEIIRHQGLASQHYAKREYREAIGEWSEVLKLDPTNSYAMDSIKRTQTILQQDPSAQAPVDESTPTVTDTPPLPPPATAPSDATAATGAATPAAQPDADDHPASLIPPVEERRYRIAAALDIFTVAGATDRWERNFHDTVTDFNATLGPTSGSFESMPGAGIRVLFLRRFPRFEVGPSLGFVGGPSALGKLDTATSGGNLHLESKIETSYLRAMAEGRALFPISRRVGFQLGAGLGFARGRIEETDKFTGVIDDKTTASKNWSGFTAEISPAFVFNVHPVTVEFGVRYAHFPTLKESDDNDEFSWNPLAVYAAVGF